MSVVATKADPLKENAIRGMAWRDGGIWFRQYSDWSFFDEAKLIALVKRSAAGENVSELESADFDLWNDFQAKYGKLPVTQDESIEAFQKHPQQEELKFLHDYYIAYRLWLETSKFLRPKLRKKPDNWNGWGNWNDAQCKTIISRLGPLAGEPGECNIPDWRSDEEKRADRIAYAKWLADKPARAASVAERKAQIRDELTQLFEAEGMSASEISEMMVGFGLE